MRAHATDPSPPAIKRSRPSWVTWTGFTTGPLQNYEAQDEGEIEVSDEWTGDVSDPRDIPHFIRLTEHLESTVKGREILDTISNLFESVFSEPPQKPCGG